MPTHSVLAARTFGLRPECLEFPTSYDVAVVGATMLWPDDEGMRQKALAAIAIELMFQSGNHPQPATPAERKEFMTLIRTVPTIADYEGPQKTGYKRGMIAGSLLYQAVASAGRDPDNVEFGEIKKRLASRFDATDHVSLSTVDNTIWPAYRCVAAYWAAYIGQGERADDAPIPCAPAALGEFLKLADHFRIRGEAIRPRQSSEGMLLRQGETVMVPAGITLPNSPWPFIAAKHSQQL